MYYSTVFTTVIYAMFTVWIYIKMEINILLILITFTCQFCLISSAVTLQVTQEECGRSIELSGENRLVNIDYSSSDFINMTGFCIIDFTTNSSNDMICIVSNRRELIDIYCTMSLSYHVGGYHPYNSKQYTCNDFNRRRLCRKTKLVSLAYSENILFKNVSISVTVFSKTTVTTTTTRPFKTWSSWSHQSSWSSWTSENDYDKGSKLDRSGPIFGIIIGIVAGLALLVVCFNKVCCKRSTPDTQNDTYTQVRYISDNQDNNGSSRPTRSTTHYTGANGNQTHSSGSQPEQPFSQDPPTYEECEKHKPVYEPDTNNEQPVPPDTENLTIPSAPPPPYPGY